jgi:hypothetical protein
MQPLNVEDYLTTQFAPFAAVRAFDMMSDGYKKHGYRAIKIFHAFMEARYRGTPITIPHIVAYMMYRVVGEEVSGEDPFSGSVALDSFLGSEVAPLVQLLHARRLLQFSVNDVKKDNDFRDKVRSIMSLHTEGGNFTHARPVYPQDEVLLRSALTLDTASRRDDAIMVLLRKSGLRSASVGAIRLVSHVFELGDKSIRVIFPGKKAAYDLGFEVVLLGEDAEVLRRWLVRRRVMPIESEYVFVTMRGTPVTTDTLTQMLYKLGNCAGYGPRFFSSHSFRSGYANREAAKILANGGSQKDVIDRLTDGRQWARNSPSIHHYIDPNLRNFFFDGYKFTHEEFENLSPLVLHDLRELHALQRRPVSWFCHSLDRLRQLCDRVGSEFLEDQFACRRGIGEAICEWDAYFRALVDEIVDKSEKPRGTVMSEVVGCLLEDDQIEPVRWMPGPHRDELVAVLSVKANASHSQATSKRAQCTHVHRLFNRRQSLWLQRSIRKRPYDRKLHLGLLPSGKYVRLKVREFETGVEQISSYPWFNAGLHFPDSNQSDADQDQLPPPIPVFSTPLSQTPSTAASSPERRC